MQHSGWISLPREVTESFGRAAGLNATLLQCLTGLEYFLLSHLRPCSDQSFRSYSRDPITTRQPQVSNLLNLKLDNQPTGYWEAHEHIDNVGPGSITATVSLGTLQDAFLGSLPVSSGKLIEQ